MARTGWLGLPKLPALPAWPWLREAEPAKQGLVLAGGGSRASFEIGALTYLYDETDFCPEVISGTSAGSILTTALAQYADKPSQRKVLAGLEQVWRELVTSEEMFAPREWYQRLLAVAPDVSGLLASEQSDDAPAVAPAGEAESRWGWFTWPTPLRRRPTRAEVEAQAAEEPGPDQHFHPLLGFGPESEEIGRGEGWSPQTLVHALAILQALGRAGGEIPTILHGAERSRAMYRPGPILRQLLSPALFQPARVATSGVKVRIATVCLETGQLLYVREDGVMVDRNDVPLPDTEPVDLVMALLASCSIPSVFAPVPLGGRHCVDGGVRENLPVEACIGHLGAPRPIVVVAAPAGVTHDEAQGHANLLGIMGRSVAILTDECLRDEVAYARATGAIVIEPEIEVHAAMVVDPGLIDINMAYGWMRAHEVMAEAVHEVVKRHRDIVLARQRSWTLENDLYGPAAEQEPAVRREALTELIETKLRLRDLLALAEPGELPAGAHEWWQRHERHAYPLDVEAVWLTQPAGVDIDQ